METFCTIAAYKFVDLVGLEPIRQRLKERCLEEGLKGTVLLAPEGINIFVSGTDPGIRAILTEIRDMPGLEDLEPKVSRSVEQPFNRMLVKIKREIIAFGVEGIDPARRSVPKVAPRELRQWLDEGRPITLLDTRNDYEVRLGTFHGARTAGIDHFRDFPEAVRRLPEALKDEPIVLFCTGGIRCEKAGPYLEGEGFRNILQLDGGILKYFEECGGAHFDGECFVFDRRVGLDPDLRETGSVLCYACQMPLTVLDQQDPRYVPDLSCPYCHEDRKSDGTRPVGDC